MARAFRAEPFIWMAWSLTVLGWILMLSAAAALQQNCNKDTHYALAVGGAVGYQGPVSCHQFYAYVWWITWYLFLMLILVAGLVAAGTLSNFRAGTLGLLAIVTMLTGDTANTFYQFKYLGLSSTAVDRARTMLAGAIIASIGLYPMLMLIGFVDEKGEQVADTGEPGGETYGGRYAPKPGSEPTQYAYPPAGMGITPGGVEVRRV